MEGKYPIMIDDALAGTLEVTKKGAMTVFDARCKGTDELLRLSVYGDDGEGYLGVMVPEGGEMRLRRSMSPLSMRGFPEEIVAAGPAGRGNAGQQGVAEKSAAPRADSKVSVPEKTGGGEKKEAAVPQTGGGETMAECAEKPGTAPSERPREENCETPSCEADCGGEGTPTPPEAGGKPGKQEGEAPCKKPPKRPEEETHCKKPPKRPEEETHCEEPPKRPEEEAPCEKPPKRPEEGLPCEKPPKRPEEGPHCEKPPKQQEEETPCEKPPEHQEVESPCEKCPEPAGAESKQEAPAAPPEPEGSPGDMEDLCWYASPDGALVCFDGVHSLIALPPADERVPKNVPGQPRQIEGRDYLVYMTKDGRIVS